MTTLTKLRAAREEAVRLKKNGDTAGRKIAVEQALFYRHVYNLDVMEEADYIDPATCRPLRSPRPKQGAPACLR